MPRIAVMEDDPPTNERHVTWISEGIHAAEVFHYHTLEECEAALRTQSFDLIVLDIALGIKRHAGIELMKQIDHLDPVPPVLVVSGLPPEHYRGVTKALGAWDFLQKPCQAHDLVAAVTEVLSAPNHQTRSHVPRVKLDPMKKKPLRWDEKPVSVTLTHIRILNLLWEGKGQPVPFTKLYEAVRSGATEENIRKHISSIRAAFREVDPDFACIRVVPQLGFMWSDK